MDRPRVISSAYSRLSPITVFIIYTVGNMMKKTFRCWKDIVIGLFAFLAVEFVDLPAVYVVVACGILGMLMYRGNEQ